MVNLGLAELLIIVGFLAVLALPVLAIVFVVLRWRKRPAEHPPPPEPVSG